MKKMLPNVFATSLFLTVIFCSLSAKSQTEFGVKGGLLFSNISAVNNNSNVDLKNYGFSFTIQQTIFRK